MFHPDIRARLRWLMARPSRWPAQGIAVSLQRQKEYSNAWTTTPSQACSQSEII